jgi:hypothetical protein
MTKRNKETVEKLTIVGLFLIITRCRFLHVYGEITAIAVIIFGFGLVFGHSTMKGWRGGHLIYFFNKFKPYKSGS